MKTILITTLLFLNIITNIYAQKIDFSIHLANDGRVHTNNSTAIDKDGNKKGNFELRGELKFPVFIKDKKIIAVSYDWEKERTYVQILRKKIGLEITLSPEPPVKIGDPVEIKVETFGFNTPEISFYINGKLLSRGEELKTLWMAEKEGIHKLKVEAKEGEVIREKEEEIEVVDPQKELYKKLLQIRKNCHCKR